jgi:hypothetical protein
LLPQEVGVHVDVIKCEKSHVKAAVAAANCQEIAVLGHVVLAVANFAQCIRESCFLSKKIARQYRRPKDR